MHASRPSASPPAANVKFERLVASGDLFTTVTATSAI
jgi:hypothetical protein